MDQCFICSNLGRNTKASGQCYGFPLCRSHCIYINYQEDKAEVVGNPAWKEIWDDTTKSRADDVEASINYLIVLRGSLENLPREIYETIETQGLKKKYLKYLPRPCVRE